MTKLDKLKALCEVGPVSYWKNGDQLTKINPADLAALLEVVEGMHKVVATVAVYTQGPLGIAALNAADAFDNWNREE